MREYKEIKEYLIKKREEGLYFVQDIEEFSWLIEKVIQLTPKIIIEVGVELGGTLQIWSDIISDDGIVIGIDLEDRVNQFDYKSYNKEIYLVDGCSYDRSTVERVYKILDGRTPDFVFIDGEHNNIAAQKDMDNYGSLVRPGGIVGFHDYHDIKEVYDNLIGEKDVLNISIGTVYWRKEVV